MNRYVYFYFFCVLGFLSFAAAAFAQTELATLVGLPVVEIRSTTFRKEELDTVQKALGIAVGSPLDLKRIDDAIQTLSTRAKYQRMFVDAFQLNKGLRIIIRGERSRKLREVHFSGIDNDILDEIKGKVILEEGRVADPRVFDLLRERLRAAYETKGYYSAEVQVEFSDISDEDGSDVEIKVVSGLPARVNKVSVVGGTKEENALMRNLVTVQAGAIFSKRLLDDSIEKINTYLHTNQYPTSKVDDSRLDFNSDKTEVDLVLSVKMNERLQFEFVGNRVFEETELRALLNDEALSQADYPVKVAGQIETRYREVGYHFCRVQAQSIIAEEGKLNLVRFTVAEGPRVLVDGLHFSNGEDRVNFPALFYETALGVLARRVFWEDGIKPSMLALRKRLQELGFLNPSLSGPKTAFTDDQKGVELFFDSELGIQTIVANVIVDGGADDLPALALAKQNELLGARAGEPLNVERLVEGKRNLLQYYQSLGYADVALVDDSKSVAISRDQKSAGIRIGIKRGRKYFIGDIRVEGNKKTREPIILDEMNLKPGDIYDPVKMRKSEEQIAVLGLFSKVEVISVTSAKDPSKKDLRIVVHETRAGSGELGFGAFYEDPRLRLRGFFGIAYKNLFGLNQTASARTELSLPFSRDKKLIPFIEYSGVLGYRSPNPLGIPLTFVSSLIFDSYEIALVQNNPLVQTRTKIEERIEKKFSPAFTGIYRLYRLERTVTEVLDGTQTPPTTEVIGSTGPGIILDFRDDIYNPFKGSYHLFDLEFASPLLLSADNLCYFMAISRNSFYIPIVSPVGFTIFLGAGYAKSLFGGQSLPRARLVNDLALGGQGSIRGFLPKRFSTIQNVLKPDLPIAFNPTDLNNYMEERADMAGFYNARAELNIGLAPNVTAAFFMDTGQLYSSIAGYNRHDGVGFGLRYRTPVGPILIDLAQGLGDDREEIKFYFSAGSM